MRLDDRIWKRYSPDGSHRSVAKGLVCRDRVALAQKEPSGQPGQRPASARAWRKVSRPEPRSGGCASSRGVARNGEFDQGPLTAWLSATVNRSLRNRDGEASACPRSLKHSTKGIEWRAKKHCGGRSSCAAIVHTQYSALVEVASPVQPRHSET